MSIAEAKRQCKAQFGRLPRMGREICIGGGKTQVTNQYGTTQHTYRYEVWLQNVSGRFQVREYVDLSKTY